MGVMPVVAAARGRATARSTTTKATASRAVAGVRPAGLARVSGSGEQRVTVRFAYGPGAIRASVKVCAESSTMDPAEVRHARNLDASAPILLTRATRSGRVASRASRAAPRRRKPQLRLRPLCDTCGVSLWDSRCIPPPFPRARFSASADTDVPFPLPPRAQNGSARSTFSASMQAPSMVKIGSQLGGGGAATLEKVGMDLSQQVQSVSQAKLADGGGGGNMGGGIKNGGGGGDGDEGDDDDYYEEGDDEVSPRQKARCLFPDARARRRRGTPRDAAQKVALFPRYVRFPSSARWSALTAMILFLFFLQSQDGDSNFLTTRAPLGEMYERDAINAVMQEWFKTLTTLPAAIRMAIEMGIVSSSQLVRFMSVDVRPSVVRLVSRSTPTAVSRAFIGRLMADPAFLWKLGFEQAITIGGGIAYEAAHRGDRLKAEWDLAASNVLQLSVANAMTVWCLTPARSFGAAHKYGWQRVMDSIPNNAFDRCGPLRQYTMGTRAASFGVKALELSALGAATGGVFHGLNKALVGLHRRNDADFEPAVPVPDLKTSVLGMGAYLGLSCNLRYQLIGGADRWMTERLTTLASAITATGLGRLANSQLGDQTRLFALGLPVHATAVRSAAPKKSKKKTVTKKVKKKKSKKNAAARETAMA